MADDEAPFDILALPRGVQNMIFERMEPAALLACAQCSHLFRSMASEDAIWERKLATHSKDVLVCRRETLAKGWKAAFLESRSEQYDTLKLACAKCARDVTGFIDELEGILEMAARRGEDEERLPMLDGIRDTLEKLKDERDEIEASGGPKRGDNVILLAPDAHLVVDDRIVLEGKGDLTIRGLGRGRLSRVSLMQGTFFHLSGDTVLRMENVTVDRHDESVSA